MALTVDDFELADEPYNDTDPGQKNPYQFVSMLPAEIRNSLHITVGTLNVDVLSYEAKGLVETWRRGMRSGIGSGLSAKGRISG
ncbi:hypothetical protein JVT61DRAFT_9979 [Boletus reticuloceps]|uniref:Uncharacterized protein n=1 Tax=Boletus reticuloceps TaxID=495285 RepID=A0A8I3AEJ0_9AGAM|nr:hypothetical protein JVT61DRAFT_9979 [Boletus reticuloceps]